MWAHRCSPIILSLTADFMQRHPCADSLGCRCFILLRAFVRAHVTLHADVSLLAFLRLIHLRITLTIPVLGGRWCLDDRRADHGAALEQQATGFERVVDDVHHLPGEPMLLEQMTKLEDRGLIGQEALPASLLLLLFKGQRGEGRLLHGNGVSDDFDILPSLNQSELP